MPAAFFVESRCPVVPDASGKPCGLVSAFGNAALGVCDQSLSDTGSACRRVDVKLIKFVAFYDAKPQRFTGRSGDTNIC